MGFKKVYTALQEIFPEIDSRVLRAVAIEHCKDPDAAVEAVLMEVIPFLTDRTNPFSVSSPKSGAGVNSSPDGNDQSLHDATGQHHQACNTVEHPNVIEGSISGNLISFEIGESSVRVGDDVSSNLTSLQQNPEVDGQCYDDADKCESSEIQEPASFNVHEQCASDLHEESDDVFLECTSSIVPVCERSEELVVHPERENIDPEEKGLKSFVNVDDKNLTGEIIDSDLESVPSSIVTCSGQICSIDLLEDIIAEARSNKKTMFAAMESLICLMKEVELQEKSAEEAKEEAAIGGLDILGRADHLKETLRRAKEANDMHAGEVYGEKAILATEVKELQSRLLNLADERDQSLAILDEMRQTLEARLDAAEREREAAEHDKMLKEELSRKALVEQELIMEKVVQESNILKQQAEENSKLQEFLVDRGRVVDMLQGEISVICKDVRMLKVKFDEGGPLSKSLSSGQTSCILASSGSFLKSMMTPVPTDQADQAADHTNSSDKTGNTIPVFADETGDAHKAATDDDWEILHANEKAA